MFDRTEIKCFQPKWFNGSVYQRQTSLEGAVCLSLASIIEGEKSEFKANIQASKELIQKVKLNVILENILKIANFVIKIFNHDYKAFDRLFAVNNVVKDLKNRYIQILDLSKVTSLPHDLLNYCHNGNLSYSVKIGLFELQKYQHKLCQEHLKNLRKSAGDKTLGPQEQKNIFDSLPVFMQNQILEKAKAHGYSKEHVQGNLKCLITPKDGISILREVEKEYAHQVTLCDRFVRNAKKEFLTLPVVEGSTGTLDPTRDRHVYEVSFTRLIESMKGSNCLSKPISVVMSGAEYAGLVKEGGLAEAIEGLSRGLKEQHQGNHLTLVFPKFSVIPKEILDGLTKPKQYKASDGTPYKVYSYEKDGIEIKFIDHPSFILAPGQRSIYGPDERSQSERFANFSKLAADFIYSTLNPDIIHLHDWHVSGIALNLKKDHEEEWKKGTLPPIVFTYHNNNRISQGRNCHDSEVLGYARSKMSRTKGNLLVEAIGMADAVTTVSRAFCLESQDVQYGEGISFAMRDAAKTGKLVGIINGTNPYRWNPESDKTLKTWKDVDSNAAVDLSYGPDHPDIMGQRALCKEQLQKWVSKYLNTPGNAQKVDIDFSKPLVTYIGRFDSYQKGLDKFKEAIESTLKNGGQFICMGMGEDPQAKIILDQLEKKYRKGVLFIRDYKDEQGRLFFQQGNGSRPGIGSLIRAASDFVFIPSRFEPCGLVQFEGWLFGSLAIGSKTGGLADTIIPLEKNKDEFNGFTFHREGVSDDSCSSVIKGAIEFWNKTDRTTKNAILKRIITTGRKYGWTTSPTKYSPVDRYRFVYEMAKKRAKTRATAGQVFNQRQALDSLIIYPKTSVSSYTQNEEQYLASYYNAEKTGISSKELEKLFLRLPKSVRSQFPSPYAVNVEHKKYNRYGSAFSPDKTTFTIYAPEAKSVSVILYDENEEVINEHVIDKNASGDWERIIQGIQPGQRYQYKINGKIKLDPYSRHVVPSKGKGKAPYSVVVDSNHEWSDSDWMKKRVSKKEASGAMSIYEMHPTTWKKKDGSYMNYRDLAKDLVKQVKKSGFTHVELMGILEHPDERSWGYQVTGYFAPNSRMGSVDDFKYMVDYLHKNNIGVILDWVPGHFAVDEYGLSEFDGSRLFEPASWKYLTSMRYMFHKFGAKHFDFSKQYTREFLTSSAFFWLKEMHLDGIRVDCVRGILQSEVPQESALFLKDLNMLIREECEGAVTIAEDYSGNTQILKGTRVDGLGFDMQWDVGWNYFTTNYFRQSPQKRKTTANYNQIRQALEQPNLQGQVSFFSHDETSQGRYGIYDSLKRLPVEDRIANFKAMISFLMTSRGSKLMFSGLEVANQKRWNEYIGTDKGLMNDNQDLEQFQKETLALTASLNKLHTKEKALYADESIKIDWIEDPSKTIHAYRKTAQGSSAAIFHNFTDTDVTNFTISIPRDKWKRKNPIEIFNSDDKKFGGKDRKNLHIRMDTSSPDFVKYTIQIPALTTIIIKES